MHGIRDAGAHVHRGYPNDHDPDACFPFIVIHTIDGGLGSHTCDGYHWLCCCCCIEPSIRHRSASYVVALALDLVPNLRDWWQLRRDLLAAALHIGLPGAAENIAYRLALLATVSMTASMGANALAAHSYTTQISFFILVFSLAVGFSCEIMVGHLIGARQLGQAHRLVSKSLKLAIFVSTSVALLVAVSS